MARDDQIFRYFQNCQRGQTQKVKLHQANRLDIILVKLADRRVTARLLVQRAKIRQFAWRNQHAAGVHADIARETLKLLSQCQQGFDIVFLFQPFSQYRLGLDRCRNRDLCAGLVRDQFADAIAKGVAHVQHAAYIADCGTRCQRAKGNDLADCFFAVFLLHIINHPVAVGLAEINVKVGHGDPFRVQKPLKQQVVMQGVQISDLQGIGHQRARARTPARPDRTAVAFSPVNEISNNQKVAWKAHIDDGADFKLKPLHVARHFPVAHRDIRIKMAHAVLQALMRGVAKIVVARHVLAVDQRRGKFGQLRLAQHQAQIAAFRNFNGIGKR